jgi:diacylglycerol kinase family enzyme
MLSEILARSLIAPDKALRWIIIANPSAGGFTINRRWKEHENALNSVLEKARHNPVRKDAAPSKSFQAEFGLVPTTSPGHAGRIARTFLEQMTEDKETFHLFITAGGDGTSLEVLQMLYYSSPNALLSNCAILRLPLGTGNDGAEAWELEDALELLINPTCITLNRGIKLGTASGKTRSEGESFLAFNILSVGIDAFVTHMTNKMKGKLPGDSYKLWVDISALLYDWIYKVGPMEIRAYDDEKREVMNFREKPLLCAMGASGRRSYGSHKMLLPDNRNAIVMRQMSLFRKLILKELFVLGTHVAEPEAIVFNASRMEIMASSPILAQMDGETIRLEKEDFPITIELTEPVIPVLKRI